MTSKQRRLASRAKKQAEVELQPKPVPPEPPPILPTPLTGLHWLTLKTMLDDKLRGDEEERRRAVEALMRHAVIREKILADLILRLDNLHTVCVGTGKYADNLARGYCEEKLNFLITTLNEAVIHDLVAEDPAKLR